jgi:hypothetical protein
MVNYLLLLVVGITFVSCKPTHVESSPKHSPKAVPSAPDLSLSLAPSLPRANDKLDVERFVVEMSGYIKKQRNSRTPYTAVDPMRSLLSIWSPLGKTPTELKTILGTPTLEKPDLVEYEILDDPVPAGYVFRFNISGGKISSFTSSSTE